jgi:hypothetical protein
MEEKPLKSVFFHFRFKFLAITSIAFLMYAILSSAAEFEQFSSTIQFKLMGPFFMGAGIFYLIFKKFPIKCPHCFKLISTKEDWHCPHCNKTQGKESFLMDKCVHCKQMLGTYFCRHCKEEFRL